MNKTATHRNIGFPQGLVSQSTCHSDTNHRADIFKDEIVQLYCRLTEFPLDWAELFTDDFPLKLESNENDKVSRNSDGQLLESGTCQGSSWSEDRLSDDLNVVGSSFQLLGEASVKARLSGLSLLLVTESCCEVDDPSCLGDVSHIYAVI